MIILDITTVSPDRLRRLPKWAQVEIENLRRDKEHAERELSDMFDSRNRSRIYADHFCTGTHKRFYIHHHRITFELPANQTIVISAPQATGDSLEISTIGQLSFMPQASNMALLKVLSF